MIHFKLSTDIKKLFRVLLTGICLTVILSVDLSSGLPDYSNILAELAGRLNTFSTGYAALPFLFAGMILISEYSRERVVQSKPILLYIISVFFGLINTSGLFMYYRDSLPDSITQLAVFALYTAACACVFLKVSYIVIFILENHLVEEDENRRLKRTFFLCWGFILLCWIPWIVSYYPASAEWDVYYPLQQFLGLKTATNHHPWAYACVIGFFYRLGLGLGDKNAGVYIYIVIRDMCMAAIYADAVCLLKKYRIRRAVWVMVLLFYAVTPVWGAYAKHAFKDALGAALFTWFVIQTIRLIDDIRQNQHNYRHYVLFAVSELVMSMFRNNFIYAAIPISIMFTLVCVRNKLKWRFAILCVIGVLIFYAYESALFNVVGIEKGSVVEALSIPLQQTARTVRDHESELTADEYHIIDTYLGTEDMAQRYDPLISDPIKNRIASDEGLIRGYMPTWLKMMFKYPKTYLEAAIAQSYGYYAFTPDQVSGAGNSNCGMTIFSWTKDTRFDSDLTLDYIDQLEKIRTFLDDWAKLWHQIPILNFTDTKAIYTWFIVLTGLVVVRKREWIKMIPVIAVLLVIVTCCASPVNDCFRYFAPAAASAPLMLALSGKKLRTDHRIATHNG